MELAKENDLADTDMPPRPDLKPSAPLRLGQESQCLIKAIDPDNLGPGQRVSLPQTHGLTMDPGHANRSSGRPSGPNAAARPSAVPEVGRPVGESPMPDSAGGRQGCAGTVACLPWPSGTRPWPTHARCRPPPRPIDTGEGRVRPCRWVGLPRRIPFVRRTGAVPGPEWSRRSSGHHSKTCRGHGGGGHPAGRRTNRTSMHTDPTARHSLIGLFQRGCCLVHAHAGAGTHLNAGELASCMTNLRGRGRLPGCGHRVSPAG